MDTDKSDVRFLIFRPIVGTIQGGIGSLTGGMVLDWYIESGVDDHRMVVYQACLKVSADRYNEICNILDKRGPVIPITEKRFTAADGRMNRSSPAM